MNNSGRAPGTPHANSGAACPGNGAALSVVVLGVLLLLTLGLGVPSFLYHCLHLLMVRSHCGPGYQDRPMCPKRNLSEPYVFLNKACHDLIPDVLASPR